MYLVTVLASGGGGNFKCLIKNQEYGQYTINHLITDKKCGAIEVAKERGITYSSLTKHTTNPDFFDRLDRTIPTNTHLVVLAGFMPIIPDWMCQKWKMKIINTHPSLLPKYGGKGMYGVKVQEAVMRNHEKYAGCTIHYVNEVIDGGDIILQQSLEVNYSETPWELGGRIFKLENKLLVEAVKLLRERHSNV